MRRMDMKRMLLSLLTALSVFGSCLSPEPSGVVREMRFRAYTETDALSRTSLGTDHRSIQWSTTDEISVFDKTSASNNRFSNSAAAGTMATFSGMAPADQYYVALYPYQADAVIEDGGETLVATLPSEQTAVAGSFGPGANLAVAYTEAGGDLYFRNVGGLLSFSFSTSHTVKSVKISASGNPMSGRVSLMSDDGNAPSVEAYGEGAYNSVTLSGNFSSGQTYYAVVLPGSFGGLKVVFTDKDGATASYSNPVPLYLDRNENISLGAFSIPESKWRTPEADEYVKVDKSYDDWSGHYLIVAGDAYAANGTVSSKWLQHKPVSVSGGKIARTSTTKEYEVTVAKVSGTQYYSLKFANGNYLGSTNSNDGIKTSTSEPFSSDTDFLWAFEYGSDGLVKIKLAQYPERILRLNGTSGFRTYSGATGTQATLFRGPSGDGQEEETAITSSGILTRSTVAARLTASYQSVTSVPSQAGFRYGKTESLGITVRSTDALSSSGTFTAELTGLEEGTLYYYQPYIVVDGVTYTGTLKSFRTESESAGSGGRGWFELPAQKDVDHNGIDDDNPDYYYSWTMRADAPSIRNFSACYSKSMRHPVWVAAPMHVSYKGSSGRNDSYRNDPAINCEQSAKFTGYTRGHMLGSSDRTVSVATNKQVFYYSNIGAQLQSGFNTGGGAWNNLEEMVDGQWCADTLYQVIGCIFEIFTDRYGNTVTKKTGTNGDGKSFQVPTAWYKVLLRTKNGNTGKRVDECTSEELKCVGVILTHRSNHQHEPSAQDLYRVSDIEALTGLEFFVHVPNAPKDSYKASDWGL